MPLSPMKLALPPALLLAAGLVIATPALMASPTTAPSAETVVRIANFTFAAQSVAVKAGTTITWVNDDDVPHTVTARDRSFKSPVLDTGDRFSFTFAKPGEFAYYCSLHPHMTGTVVVRD